MLPAGLRTFKPGLSTPKGCGADSALTVNAVKQQALPTEWEIQMLKKLKLLAISALCSALI
jgi:hypothetical protein